MSESKSILLVNDLPGFGKVALSAMIPILSAQGHRISNLPTALVSNTLDYGIFEIHDTTDYIRKTLEIWEQLNLQFDYMCTGYLCNGQQAELLTKYKKEHPATFLLVDPIMGDDGKLYNGVPEETIVSMRKLSQCADLLVPNATEAALLVHGCVPHGKLSKTYYYDLLDRLHKMGAKSTVITSAACEGNHCIFGYDNNTGTCFDIPYNHLPVRFPGTGDVFSALVLSKLTGCTPLKQAVQYSAETVFFMIHCSQELQDLNFGLPLEQLLSRLKNG